MAENQQPTPPGTQTLARGLAVIAAVGHGHTSLRAITAATGIGRSTTHRLVQLLVQQGYLRPMPERTYSLGPTLIELGFQALADNPVTTVAAPVLRELHERVHDTVHLAVEDHRQVLYLDKLPGTRGPEMRSRIGHRMPLTRTGVGKALLLESPDRWREQYVQDTPVTPPEHLTREPMTVAEFVADMARAASRGAAYDLEENEPGIRCVAGPVRDGSGAIVAAVSVSATRPYMPMERVRALVPVVQRAAAQVSGALGYARPPRGVPVER
ncbi:IclR family transcriptional regulator [Georgenia sp. TF02-10]|uniref:IclR family transcriptional regulator n=1 Tax=Georgenia sp. TF02-10 TaxID=2917725 RepID=UPI001FA787A3|nr:IclR family transcriptional regulator [Georgenia sp. TF02-10]UNX54847.1 IclR family transcriptional regulator [Georgenia sp. TF02-10]